jgi:DMSO reductase family type II enzyme chaperone
MNLPVVAPLERDEELRAAARSRVYAAFCDALAFPDAERLAEIREGSLARCLRAALRDADPELAADHDWEALAEVGAGDDDLAVEYTRLFEVGAAGPPCPLYGGLYGDARMKTMEEAVRFYNHFGLTLSEQPRELPDHLTTELEFLHFLCFREVEALHERIDPGPYRRAQRDFVARHPGRFVPKLSSRLARARASRFYRELFAILARWLAREERALVALAGPAPPV